MDYLSKIKEEITPDTSVLTQINEFISEINSQIKAKKIKATCIAGGSVAKGTFLKGDFDVDLFVKFDYSYNDKLISDMLEKILSKNKPERLHGSRDYFQLKKENLNYEIVPVLDVKDPEKALNVTDMSPMHVFWVKKHLKKGQEDDIRLAKKFCKSIGVYGAESYISGFSGHVIDILIIKYGSFLSLLKESKKWKPKVIIDTEKYYKNSQELLFSMNTSKIEGPMIVVDPMLRTRNASSSLSYEKFSAFKKQAALFLKRPSEKFFQEEETGITYLKKKYKKNLCVVSLKSATGKTDIIGSRILKSFKELKSNLVHAGFEIKDSGWYWNKKQRVLFWFIMKDMMLPAAKVVNGPPIEMKNACLEFRAKYKATQAKDGKLTANVKNEKRKLDEIIKDILETDYFKGKISLNNIDIIS
ncbi:MAG: nucleotidyltransferase domain-containing protein [archaeon]